MMSSSVFFKDIKDYGRRCVGSGAVTGITSFTLFAAIQHGRSRGDSYVHHRARWVTPRTSPNAATIGCTRGTVFQSTGQTPPVSNVFHSLPQVQNHLSSLWGDQPHSGQRMREPDGS